MYDRYKIKLLLKEGEIKVFLVNGDSIRKELNPRFKDTGIRKKYSFVPLDEIWIDEKLHYENRDLIVLKALREYNLIKDGMDISDTCAPIESILAKCRRSPLQLPYRTNRELAKIRRRSRI